MDRRERIAAHVALAGLSSNLRQWEAADAVATAELEKRLSIAAKVEYMSPGHAGLLGTLAFGEIGAGLDAVGSARRILSRQAAASAERLLELHADMQGIAGKIETLAAELPVGEEAVLLPRTPLTTMPAVRSALRLAADALQQEVELRKSLLDVLPEVVIDKDERRRLLITWSERPFSDAQEGTQLFSLAQRIAVAVEALA